MKKITLTLSENDALIVRDALIDASLALRTRADGTTISEPYFLKSDISDRKRERYLTLRDYALRLKECLPMKHDYFVTGKCSGKPFSISVVANSIEDARVTATRDLEKAGYTNIEIDKVLVSRLVS